jgi:hypothetical protein
MSSFRLASLTPLRARLESWCRNVLWKHKLFRT